MSDRKRWLQEHFSDAYVKQAQHEGYPSRAAYKLLELQKKDQLIKPGGVVVDLGASPGGWSMVAQQLVGSQGLVVAVDLLDMDVPKGVHFIQGDFIELAILNKVVDTLAKHTKDGKADLVISDMAPNITGQKSIDQPRSLTLLELAWSSAQSLLREGGTFLAKVFQGAGVDSLVREMRLSFSNVKYRKPQASRARSSEIYILGKHFLGYNESRSP